MAYIGTQPLAGQYRKLDDISGGFNGSTTSFTTSVGGTNVTAGSPQQLLVSLGGVIQQPTTDYTVNTSTITFTTAPTSGLSFFAILMGDALNTSVPADGSITSAKLAGSLSVGLAAGSASTPSLFFSGDANTGIYSPGADQVALTTAGTARLYVSSAGLVGIGSTAPSQRLTIETTASGDGIRLFNNDATSGSFSRIGFQSANSWDTSSVNAAIDAIKSGAGTATNLRFLTAGDNSTGSAGLSERARIDSSGRLLVGTSTSLSNALEGGVQIVGTAADAYLTITRFGGATASAPAGIVLGRSRSGTKGTNTAVADGDFLGAVEFTGADGGSSYRSAAQLAAYVDGAVSGGGAADMPGRLVFSTTADGASSPTERMRIGNNGSVQITASTSVATGTHTIRDSGASPNTVRLYNDTDSNNTGNRFLICDTAASVLRAEIRTNGGLANFSANNANLSDRNAKKDISPAADTWNCLKEWEIVNYRYKDQPDDADLNLGVIAQQVAESCPEVITVFQEAKEATEDAPAREERLGVKEQQMYWMAIKALQEAQVRIEQLESKVAALEGA